MSAGAFTIGRYAASYGAGTAIHPIRVQPETLTLTIATVANTAPTGAISNPISARVSGGRRAIGLGCRKVTVKFSGALPANLGYLANGSLTLPWLNPFTVAIAKGAVGTYQGAAIIVTGISPEIVK